MRKKPRQRPKYTTTQFWWRGIRANPIKFCVSVFSLIGAFAVAYHNWGDFTAGVTTIAKWVVPAPIAYAQSYADGVIAAHKAEHKAEMSVVLRTLRDSQIDQAQGKLEASKRALRVYEFQKLKTATPEEALKVDQAMRDERETYDALQDQIRTLRSGR